MKGLILKDLLNLKKQVKIYIVAILFFAINSISTGNFAFLSGMVCLFCAMMPVTALSYDERAKWDKYALSMPVSRNDMIISKYLLGIITSGIGLTILILFQIILFKVTKENILTSFIVFGISIIFLSVLLPILFKFGVEKGRIIMMLIFFAPTMIGVGVSKINIPQPSQNDLKLLLYSFPFIVLVFLGLSLYLSLNIYAKKEL